MSRSRGFANSSMEVMPREMKCGGETLQWVVLLILALALTLAHAQSEAPLKESESWSKMNALSVARPVTILIAVILLPISLTSCGKSGSDGEKKTTQKSEDDFLDKDAKPDERKYLLAAKPFFVAVANRKYADAYALLSGHAKARMSFNQFTPAEEQATFQQYESSPYMNVTAEQFAYLMRYVEAARGTPRASKMLSVFSTDPDVLNRRSKEQFGAMDSMFAIGAMPDWIPANIRRASLRGQIHTELSPQELQNVAQREGISVEELKKDPDFDPYFNLKVVLVDEGGQLKVGYFEFLPPSIMD